MIGNISAWTAIRIAAGLADDAGRPTRLDDESAWATCPMTGSDALFPRCNAPDIEEM
jgi:hypothetical protein